MSCPAAPAQIRIGQRQREMLGTLQYYAYHWLSGPDLQVARSLERHGLVRIVEEHCTRRAYLTDAGRELCRERGIGRRAWTTYGERWV